MSSLMSTTLLHKDTAYLHKLRQLIIYGCRLGTLRRLGMSEDTSDKVMGKIIATTLNDAFCKDPYPKWRRTQNDNSTFLKSPTERYHASVIHALASRIDLTERVANSELVDALLGIHAIYLDAFGVTPDVACFTINEVFEVIVGMRELNLGVETCSNCSGKSIYNYKRPKPKKCIFCDEHAHPPYTDEILDKQAQRKLS